MKVRERGRWALLLWLALLPALTFAQGIQASLDRTNVPMGSTVTLNLTLPGSYSGAAPDLTPLQRDFDILGSSSSSNLSVVNGRTTSAFTYGIALRPRHAGTLTIPALQMGNATSQPLTLTVTQDSSPPASQGDGAIFLQASVEPRQAYVGQQLTLTVRLFYAANLVNGSLTAGQIKGADMRQIGKDLGYQTQRGGRTYNVIERRYAVVPQRAGNLTIPPVQFQGDLLAPNDPGSFFGMGEPAGAASPSVTVPVKSAPADWGNATWLPARALSLSLDGLPGVGESQRVGQSFDITLNLEATGLASDTLPSLSLPALDGATAYPSKPVTGDRDDGTWVIGRRQHSFAIVPDRAGTLTIPAITLKWFNVVTGKPEVASIPARRLTVLPGANGAGAAPPAGSAPIAAASSAAAPVASSAAQPVLRRAQWHWNAIILSGVVSFLAVALMLLLIVWLRRRPMPHAAPTNVRRARRAFFDAARSGDVQRQSRALLDWARAERPSITTLGALAAALASHEQREAIDALQRQRYAAMADSPSPHAMQSAFAHGLQWLDAAPADGDDGSLPPLYPFKLR